VFKSGGNVWGEGGGGHSEKNAKVKMASQNLSTHQILSKLNNEKVFKSRWGKVRGNGGGIQGEGGGDLDKKCKMAFKNEFI